DGIRDGHVTGVQTCSLPICHRAKTIGYAHIATIILGREFSARQPRPEGLVLRIEHHRKLSLMPSMMNCTAIAHNTNPMRRVRMRMPVCPRRRSTIEAAESTRNVINAVRTIEM